jgi:formylglycine-generating enzyme required for sulfatase activity
VVLAETIWPKVLTGDAERALQPGETFTECAFCPEMVVIPAGEFMMGSPGDEPGHRPIEGPQHKVVIPNRFAMAKLEASFDEWDACLLDGGCQYSPPDKEWGRRGMPVINVSWYDIQPYLAWLIRRTGKPYRLPTEAEWEFAARAGTTTAYYWGDEPGTGNANCDGCSSAGERRRTAPRGSFQPNAFGLHDMLGNVWERVEDCFAEYADTPRDGTAFEPKDDTAQTRIACATRVVRGGAWKTKVEGTRTAVRGIYNSATRFDSFGFRVVRSLAAP